MHSQQRLRHLSAVVGMLVVSGCGDEMTAPASRPGRLHPVAPPSLSTTNVSGNVVTATSDDGTTISVDRANHTVTFNGQTVIVTQEAADSVANQFMRMYSTEQAADAALSAPPPPPPPPPSLCDDPSAPCDLGHAARLGTVGDVSLSGPTRVKRTRKAIVTEPIRIGSIVPSASTSSVVGYDPSFTCTDISLAIYNAMPNYRAAKTALFAALAREGYRLYTMSKALPQLPGNPTTWYGWGELYTRGPILDYLYANFEHSRIQLDYFAIMFRVQNCYTPPSSPPSSGGGTGGGSGGGRTCYWEITWIAATGQVIDMRFLGCW